MVFQPSSSDELVPMICPLAAGSPDLWTLTGLDAAEGPKALVAIVVPSDVMRANGSALRLTESEPSDARTPVIWSGGMTFPSGLVMTI